MHNRRDMGPSSRNARSHSGSTEGTTGSPPYYIPLVMHALRTANAADGAFARCRTRAAWPCTNWEVRLMEDASRQAHWDNVYTTKGENEVSWFQQSPAPSLELIAQAGATHASAIIDIG